MKLVLRLAQLALALTVISPAAGAVNAKSLRDCAMSPDNVLIDYEHKKSYIFTGNQLFRIQLPAKGGLVSLPPTAFPGERHNCFDFTRGGRVKFEDLTAAEMKQCQDAKKRVSFAPASKSELASVATLVMGDYFQFSEEIGTSILAPEPTTQSSDVKTKWRAQRKWGLENLISLKSKFKGCDSLTDLNDAARETQADVRDRLDQLTQQAISRQTQSRLQGTVTASAKSVR